MFLEILYLGLLFVFGMAIYQILLESKKTEVDKIKNRMAFIESMSSFDKDISRPSEYNEMNWFSNIWHYIIDPIIANIIYWGEAVENSIYEVYNIIYDRLILIIFDR